METYEFELILSGGPALEDFAEQMAEALWTKDEDCSVGVCGGVRTVGYHREATSLEEAVLSAINDVISKGLGSRVVLVRDENGQTLSMPPIVTKIESQQQPSSA